MHTRRNAWFKLRQIVPDVAPVFRPSSTRSRAWSQVKEWVDRRLGARAGLAGCTTKISIDSQRLMSKHWARGQAEPRGPRCLYTPTKGRKRAKRNSCSQNLTDRGGQAYACVCESKSSGFLFVGCCKALGGEKGELHDASLDCTKRYSHCGTNNIRPICS